MFRKAVELAPDYADALAGLCDTLLFQYSAKKDKTIFIAAENACLQAQSLDSQAHPLFMWPWATSIAIPVSTHWPSANSTGH